MPGTNPPFAQWSLASVTAGTLSVPFNLASGGESALVTNASSSLAWVTLGTASAGGTLTAVPGAGYPVLANSQRVVAASPFVNAGAVILSAGSGTVIVEIGAGAAR